ncbi:DUF885 domain-containing protein [Undibacterium cyanobacteriorum]|uniref:DUF885 domain-containing protein n=1 Tax=Undibacterium cyanobacteriorum TaxID=3073561 RepID=A0ABY9RL03_9BURK|nr:DUF885 domain-containing protein [Undibacterium sp. 20NA77.5]WMW81514.1 DUF885 domain-containing protein [Undibacterium sp. 20NA77.5]
MQTKTKSVLTLRRVAYGALLCTVMASNFAATPIYAAERVDLAQAVKVKKQLDQLADAFYDARAKFEPMMMATANGDSRFDDQIGLSINPANRARQFKLYHTMQAKLKLISRDQLGSKEQLNYDLLAFELDSALNFEHFPEHLLPLNQMDNVPSTVANYASGTGSQPLHTVKNYQAYLNRLKQLTPWINQAIANMRVGIKQGIVHPKAITVAMLPQFKQLQSTKVEDSIFYSPIKRMPAEFSQADQEKLKRAYHETIEKQLNPAVTRLVKFLEHDYLKAGRDSTGLNALPNGAAWYQARIKDHTTTSLTPDEIHALGLKEVARIQQQWDVLAPQLGYSGPSKQLPTWVAAQDKFKPFSSDQEVLEAYRKIDAQVRAKLPALFSMLPKAELSLQLEPELSRATASDHYTPAADDGSHPGVFWAVVNDPKKYSRTGMVTLFLHEGQPGHHLHAALLKEMDLPNFRKFNTENFNSAAYTEGWALYSETLGREMGFYEDPAYYFGHLNDELLRAVRLVVDTGMHAKGWTREQAITYMMENLGYSEARAKNQVERYMVIPGQALAYKIGALKILELRAKAQQALGSKFTLADFHKVVVGDGTLPMPILEQQINRWIAAAK